MGSNELLRTVYTEITRSANADQLDRAEYLYQIADVIETHSHELHLCSTGRQHKISEHIAKRAQGAAKIPLLLDSMYLHFTATDLDYGIAGELIEGLVAAELQLIAGHTDFVAHLRARGPLAPSNTQ
jgi:uncharacterized phosphosugar-binding protein